MKHISDVIFSLYLQQKCLLFTLFIASFTIEKSYLVAIVHFLLCMYGKCLDQYFYAVVRQVGMADLSYLSGTAPLVSWGKMAIAFHKPVRCTFAENTGAKPKLLSTLSN